MNLTEQWKDGELPEQDENHEWLSYYIKHKNGLIHSDSYWRGSWGIADRNSIEEVLEPVPSYEEVQELESDRLTKIEGEEIIAELTETNDSLSRQVKHLLDLQANQDKEVESLRDLLKECKFYVEKDFECIRANGWTKEGVFNDLYELLTRINTAIGESEE